MKFWIIACSALFFVAPALAQHTFSRADLDDGARLFRAKT